MTQNKRILDYCKTHDGLTTLEASDRLRVCRLSERIRELEAKGYTFSHTPEHTEHARVIRYKLITGDKRSASNASCGQMAPNAIEAGSQRVTRDSPPYKPWMA